MFLFFDVILILSYFSGFHPRTVAGTKVRTTESKANSQADDIVILEKKTQLAQLMLEIHTDRAEEKTRDMDKTKRKRSRSIIGKNKTAFCWMHQ